ncbi:MAG TPA: HYR domain-containing protein [Gaiellaceae bacterium]|nr:HYR domain-containing protein [Gaiellaceae bacterium]
MLAVLALVAVGVFGVGTAAAATPRALINGDTVSGGTSSLEAQQASALGFSVDVVSGSQWDSMSQSDFAQYQVLIIGDPTCSLLAGSVSTNASTWIPVVMGTAGGNTQAGNRIVIGTDPVFHYHYGHPGAINLIHDGIAFAGAQPGRTGLYFDDTCGDYYNTPSAVQMLQSLSAGTGTWTKNASPPCGGSASLIASNALIDTVSSSDLQGWSCSIHESFPTYASDWSPLAIATDAPTHPTCGNDVDTGAAVCGEAYILVAGSGIVVTAPDISVDPTDQSPSGSTATVTAHVEQGGSPLVGQTVTWTVTGQNAGAAGTCAPADCTTDSNGDVSFTYSGTNGAGDDTVVASFTTSGGSVEQASGAVHWTVAADTTPPTLGDVDDVTVEATGPGGATASYATPTATDDTDPAPTVDCSPASGTQFALGDTVVTCTATDASGNSASKTFTVHVVDTTPPDLNLPADKTVEATSSSGAAAWFTVTANDLVDGATTVTCDAADGSTFALGTTTVHCSSTDAHGNTATGSFHITVVDTTPPTLSLPAGQTLEATGPSGAAASWTASATDIVDGSTAVTCSPASGSTFALGTTTVNCSSTDAAGNTSTGSFDVTVVDTTAPTLSLPANQTVDADSPAGTVVTYHTSAYDLVDGVTAVTCSPASGSTFAVGTTTVNCSSTDAHGNTSTGSFTVKVRSPLEMTTLFCPSLKGVGPGSSFYDKCMDAKHYIAIGDTADAIATLKAFKHEVAAQSGKKITAAKAASLTATANAIIAALGG